MNLETKIDSELWKEINSSYENKRFTEAIKESIYFLGDLIRNKANLTSDGVTLIGQAFGGKNPKLRINKLQSETDINEQNGLEQILRGIFQLIRNPRSHKKYQDNSDDADTIILFINYLIKIIEKSKSQFSVEGFIERVFDKSFVGSDKYAELLIKEIPEKKKLDIFIEAYKNKDSGDGKKLKYFFKKLFEKLNNEELKQTLEIISDELMRINDDKLIRYNLQILPSKYWTGIEEISRLRIENRIIESIDEGKYFDFKETSEGWLATWSTEFLEYFVSEEELSLSIFSKFCSSDKPQHDYAVQYFSSYINQELRNPNSNIKFLIEDSLRYGNINVYNYLKNISNSIKKNFKSSLDEFTEPEEQDNGSDDFTDDDIPF